MYIYKHTQCVYVLTYLIFHLGAGREPRALHIVGKGSNHLDTSPTNV
jgi:hypothetical protein